MKYNLWFSSSEIDYVLEHDALFEPYGSSVVVNDYGVITLEWTRGHIPTIQRTLRELRGKHSFPVFHEWEYSYTPDGTLLFLNILEQWATTPEARAYTFGYLIFHQLMYAPELVCTIE